MLAVVMAGGKGTRLRPLTCDRPKPMVPVANRPMLEHIVRLLTGAGWREIALTLCYQPEKIQGYFGQGEQFGAKLHYFVEDHPLGTAGSVKLAAGLFQDTVLVGSGDALTDIDLQAALNFHRERGAAATIVLTRVPSPLEYGVVITEPDGRIARFLEKPGWGEVFSDTVNTGFYLIEPRLMELVPAGKAFDFSRDLFPLLLERREKLYGYIAEGYWSDVGTLEQYRRTHLDILAGRVRLTLPGQEHGQGIWLGQGAEIDPEAKLEGPVLCGDYCRVERGAELGAFTVLGDYSLVAAGASIKRSVLWRHTYVGAKTEVRGPILCEHAILRNAVAVYEDAVVGDGSLLGAHSTLQSGVKLWPGKHLESGSMVRESLVWNERPLKGLFGAAGVTGVANLEITPEYAAKLGAAYAANLGQGREVAVGADGSPVANLLKGALSAGILGAGVHVRDLGAVTGPVMRFGVGSLGLAGGVYLRLSSHDAREVTVQFLDARGLPLNRQGERALEQVFLTEDFPRVDGSRVGGFSAASRLDDAYLDELTRLVDADAIRAAGFLLILGRLQGPAADLLPKLLARLGCRYVEPGSATGDDLPNGREGFKIQLESLREELAARAASLALAMDLTSEELYLMAPGGRTVSEAQLSTLLSLAELRQGANRSLPVPVTATEAIADLARTHRGRLVRTKAQRRSLLEEFAAAAPSLKGLMMPAFDALFALGRLLELLAKEGRDLNTLLAGLPSYERVEEAVACTWQAKGMLMRRLIEGSRDLRVELTDGLRVQEERGWTLVLPDGEEPVVRVYSEARTAEDAEALSRSYLGRIAALNQEENLV